MHTSTIRLGTPGNRLRWVVWISIERFHMSIVVRFHPTALTAAKYDESIQRLEQTDGGFPPEGLVSHVCFGSEAPASRRSSRRTTRSLADPHAADRGSGRSA